MSNDDNDTEKAQEELRKAAETFSLSLTSEAEKKRRIEEATALGVSPNQPINELKNEQKDVITEPIDNLLKSETTISEPKPKKEKKEKHKKKKSKEESVMETEGLVTNESLY